MIRRAEIAIPYGIVSKYANVIEKAYGTWRWTCSDPDIQVMLNHYLSFKNWRKEYAPDTFEAMVRATAREFSARITVEPEPDFSYYVEGRVY